MCKLPRVLSASYGVNTQDFSTCCVVISQHSQSGKPLQGGTQRYPWQEMSVCGLAPSGYPKAEKPPSPFISGFRWSHLSVMIQLDISPQWNNEKKWGHPSAWHIWEPGRFPWWDQRQHNYYFKIKDVVTAWDEWESDCVLRVVWRPHTGVVLGWLASGSAQLCVTFCSQSNDLS